MSKIGPIARAFVEIVARADGIGDDIKDQLRRELRGLDQVVARSLNRVEGQFRETGVVAAQALDGLGRGAKREAAEILLAFDRALEQIEDEFGEMSAAGRRDINRLKRDLRGLAGARVGGLATTALPDVGEQGRVEFLRARSAIAREMRAVSAAAEAADQDIRQVGLRFLRVGVEARKASEAATRSFSDMAREIRADIERISHVTGFDDLFIEAEDAAGRIERSFAEASRAATADLRRIAEAPAFREIREEVLRVAEAIEREFRESAARAIAALELIGESGNFREIKVEAATAGEVLERELGGSALRVAALIGSIDNAADLGKLVLESRAASEAVEQIGQEALGSAARLSVLRGAGAGSASAIRAGAAETRRQITFFRKTLGNIIQSAAITGAFALTAIPFLVGGLGLKTAAEFQKIEIAIVGLIRAENSVSFGNLEQQLESGIGPAAILRDRLSDLGVSINELGGNFEIAAAQIQAKGALNDLRQLALDAPVGFRDVAEGFSKLLAAGRSAGTATEDLRGLLGLLVGLGVENPAENIGRITLALGQIGSSARVDGRDVRQLREALPGFDPASATATRIAEKYGITVAEAYGRISSGAIDGAEFVNEFLIAVDQSAVGAGALERAVNTLAGQFEKLKESAEFALRDGFTPLVKFLQEDVDDSLAGLAISITPRETFGQFIEDVPTVIDLISQELRFGILELSEGIAGAVESILPSIIRLIEPLASTLGSLFSGIGEIAAGFLDAITPAVLTLSGALEEIVDSGGLRDIGEAVGRLAAAFLDVASAGLPTFVDLLEILADVIELIPSDILTLAAAFVTLNAAVKGIGLSTGLIGLVKGLTTNLPLLFTALRGGSIVADVGSTFQGIARTIAVGVASIRTAFAAGGISAAIGAGASGIASAISLPITLAIAGITVGVGLIAKNFLDSRRRAAEFRQEVKRLGQEFDTALGDPDISAFDVIFDELRDEFKDLPREQASLAARLGLTPAAIADAVRAGQSIRDIIRGVQGDIDDFVGKRPGERGHGGRIANRNRRDLADEVVKFYEDQFKEIGTAARDQLGAIAINQIEGPLLESVARSLDIDLTKVAIPDLSDDQAIALLAAYEGEIEDLFSKFTSEELDKLVDPAASQEFEQQVTELIGGLFPEADAITAAVGGEYEANIIELGRALRSGQITSTDQIRALLSQGGFKADEQIAIIQAVADEFNRTVADANRIFLERLDFGAAAVTREDFLDKVKIDISPADAAQAYIDNLKDILTSTRDRLFAEAELSTVDLGDAVSNLALQAFTVTLPDDLFGDQVAAGLAALTPGELNAQIIGPFIAKVQEVIDQFNRTRPDFAQVNLGDVLQGLVAGEFNFETLRADLEAQATEAGTALAEAIPQAFTRAFEAALATSARQPVGGESIFATPGFEIDGQFIDTFAKTAQNVGALGPDIVDTIIPQATSDAIIVKFGEVGDAGGQELGKKAGEAIPAAVTAAVTDLDLTPVLGSVNTAITTSTAALQAQLAVSFLQAGLTAGTSYGAGLLLAGLASISSSIATIGAIAAVALAAIAVSAGVAGANVGAALVAGFVGAVAVGGDEVLAVIQEFAATLSGAIAKAFDKAAAVGIDAYVDGLAAGTARGSAASVTLARVLGASMVAAVSAQLFLAGFRVGQQFTAGIAAGIIAYFQRILRALQLIALLTRLAAYAAFGISSPSKIGIGVGQFFSEGVAVGIRDGIKDVELAAGRDLVGAVANLEPPTLRTRLEIDLGDMPDLGGLSVQARLDLDAMAMNDLQRTIVDAGQQLAAPARAGGAVAASQSPTRTGLRQDSTQKTLVSILKALEKGQSRSTEETEALLTALAELDVGSISVSNVPAGADANTVAALIKNRVKRARTRVTI